MLLYKGGVFQSYKAMYKGGVFQSYKAMYNCIDINMTNRRRKSSRGKESFRGPFIVQPPVPCFTLFRPRVVVEVTFRGTEVMPVCGLYP